MSSNNIFNTLYRDFGKMIIDNGTPTDDRTGAGTISVFGGFIDLTFYNNNSSHIQSAPFLSSKKINLRAIIGELLWFLEGSVDVNVLKDDYGCNFWDEWKSPVTGTIGPMYGVQWRGDDKRPDQFARLINELVTNPTSRRMIVNCWEASCIPDGKTPPKDNPENGLMALAPCHYSYQFNTHPNLQVDETVDGDGGHFIVHGLSLKVSLRSSDYILGLPTNVASYYILLSLVADYLNDRLPDNELYVLHSLIFDLGDAHIYQNHMDVFNKILRRNNNDEPIFETTTYSMEVFETYLNKDFKGKNMSEYRKHAVDVILDCVHGYKPLSGLLASRNV